MQEALVLQLTIANLAVSSIRMFLVFASFRGWPYRTTADVLQSAAVIPLRGTNPVSAESDCPLTMRSWIISHRMPRLFAAEKVP
jgi:hypothetical protein